uniref:Uncharacterized protein n=1 Tax=Panagrolaimus sp. JU765 TaxID=591449 RepID=A0AC34QZN2_9BILA
MKLMLTQCRRFDAGSELALLVEDALDPEAEVATEVDDEAADEVADVDDEASEEADPVDVETVEDVVPEVDVDPADEFELSVADLPSLVELSDADAVSPDDDVPEVAEVAEVPEPVEKKMIDQDSPMSPNPTRNVSTNVHVVSARISSNPFALLDFLCWKVKTREHSQFVGCLSFALFICLTVASFVIFEAMSVFFIITGIVVYAFLSESLFRQPKLCGIMFYIIFEGLQIGFYIATIIYLLADMIFYNQDNGRGHVSGDETELTPTPNGLSSTTSTTISSNLSSTTPMSSSTTTHSPTLTSEASSATQSLTSLSTLAHQGFKLAISHPTEAYYPDNESYSTLSYIFWIVIFLLLLVIKLYFLRVFTHYYNLFRQPKLCGIMFYIIFEGLQIGFYIATIIYLLADMIFYNHDNGRGHVSGDETELTPTPNGLSSTTSTTISSNLSSTTLTYIFWIVIFLLLLVIKLYFLRVFTHYYKFVAYQERHSNELRAEYVNGRSVNFGFHPRQEYDNPVVNDPGYGYGIIYPTTTPLPELPTYHEAMSTGKPPILDTTPTAPTPGQSFSSFNPEDPHRHDRI